MSRKLNSSLFRIGFT
uniref:Uncharacterized protein n=1 Tax=Anguilla anguilla TaxID=7936 RepID=A0A0E9VM66_ANGAN